MKPALLAQFAFVLVAAFFVYSFVVAAQRDVARSSCTALCAYAPAYSGDDRRAPDFELPDMAGKPVKLSSFRGKTVLLNFWTKTCKPCLEEMPSIAELAEVVKSRSDIVVLSVSTDGGPADVSDTLEVALGKPVNFPVLFDPEAKVVGDKYGTTLFPETWIIDPNGVIVARFDGARDWSRSLSLEILENTAKFSRCPVSFVKGKPTGASASLCEE